MSWYDGDGVSYYDDAMIRDVVYFFHECSDYRAIAFDLIYETTVLGLPYYEAFLREGDDEHDRLIREGAVLIFLGMLEDCIAGSGNPFVRHQGGGRMNDPDAYVSSLLAAYADVSGEPESRMTPLLAACFTSLAHLDSRLPLDADPAAGWSLEVRPDLAAQVRAVVERDHLSPAEGRTLSHAEIYSAYIHPYFAERA